MTVKRGHDFGFSITSNEKVVLICRTGVSFAAEKFNMLILKQIQLIITFEMLQNILPIHDGFRVEKQDLFIKVLLWVTEVIEPWSYETVLVFMIQLLTWGYRIFVPGVIALSIIITVIHELSTLGCLTLKVTNIRRTRRLVRCSSSLCTFLQSLSLVVHTWLHPYIGYQSIS